MFVIYVICNSILKGLNLGNLLQHYVCLDPQTERGEHIEFLCAGEGGILTLLTLSHLRP